MAGREGRSVLLERGACSRHPALASEALRVGEGLVLAAVSVLGGLAVTGHPQTHSPCAKVVVPALLSSMFEKGGYALVVAEMNRGSSLAHSCVW